jgi:hypothetical protein
MAYLLRRILVLGVLLGTFAGVGSAPDSPPASGFTRSVVAEDALLLGRSFLIASDWATGALCCPVPLVMKQSASYGDYSARLQSSGYRKETSAPYESGSLVNRQYGSQPPSVASLLTAAGVPNDRGQIRWPLALKALPPGPETLELRRQLEAHLQVLATELLAGKSDPRLVREANDVVDKLQARLVDRGYLLASGTYEDGVQFLKKLHKALALFP